MRDQTQSSLIRVALAKRGWGISRLVRELALLGIKVRRQTVYRWVSGENPPKLSHIITLCDLLGLDVEDFARACARSETSLAEEAA